MGKELLVTIGLFLQLAAQSGTPLLLGTLGGILGEKAGNLNLGVEGMMMMGAVAGFYAGVVTGNAWLVLLAAGLAGALGALLYAIVTVTFQGNQTVTGLTLTIFGTGVANYVGQDYTSWTLPASVTEVFRKVAVPYLSDIPLLGPMLFNQSIYVMLAIVLAILIWIYLNKTRLGLNLRMVGENPAAADASGINVNLYKYVHLLAGGFLCGLGGAFLSVVFITRWQVNLTAGLGWIAVALVIFCTWNPILAIIGGYFFGGLRSLGLMMQNTKLTFLGFSLSLNPQFLDTLPYLMTVFVLVIISIRGKKESQPPGWLSLPYYREDR
jgi:ABC-type uncharacterized transport system permease subunit